MILDIKELKAILKTSKERVSKYPPDSNGNPTIHEIKANLYIKELTDKIKRMENK